jgi:titin
MQKGLAVGGFRPVLLLLMAVLFATVVAKARALTAPTGTPVLYADAVSPTLIVLKWSDIEGETQYRIERLDRYGWVEIGAVGGNSANFLDDGLEPGKLYTYRVRGWNSAGYSEYSNQSAATTWPDPNAIPAVPRVTSNFSTDTSIDLFWAPIAGATGYRLEAKTGATGTWAEIANVPAEVNAFTHTNLTASTDYYYRLRAYNTAGISGYSSEEQVRTLKPPPPSPELQGIAQSYNALELRWKDVLPCNCVSPGYIGYRLEAPSGPGWTNVAYLGVDVTNYAVKALQPATEYSYRIRAENPMASEWSYVTVKTEDAPPIAPQAPVLYAEKESGRSIRVKWLDVELETEYRIEKRNAAGEWEQIATVPANILYYIDSGLEPLTTYTYRIRAANSYGVSPYSNESAGTTGPPPEIPRIYARANAPSKIEVFWYAAEGAVLYRLERDSGSGWQNIYESTTEMSSYPPYIDAGLTDFNYYKYRVGAQNAAGTWFYSAEIGARPHFAEMVQTQVSAKAISTSAIELSWGLVPFAGSYYVVKIVDGSWLVRTQLWGSVTSYIDTSLSAGTTYTYLVYGQRYAEPETAATSVTTLSTDSPGIAVYSIGVEANSVTLRLAGSGGQRFKIQSSSNFTNWSDVTEAVTLSADMQLSVPRQADTEKMFYRTISVQ